MDDSFQLRANQMLNGRRAPAPLAHDVLSTALAAQQATSPTACAQARIQNSAPRETEPLIELLLAGSAWQAAASDQQGCFNRAESKRRRNGA